MFSDLHRNFDQKRFEHFKRYRNTLNRAIQKAKEMYYNELMHVNKNQPGKLWDIPNDLSNLKPRKQFVPTELITDKG